ncbi:MAG: hypothetical protein HC878_00040 [Leptolyngbyaceae cyanobacterium SL_5_14]|nr:hypothetical protein [Leptolyngbyaceae cyanobacterium SL_5_14]
MALSGLAYPLQSDNNGGLLVAEDSDLIQDHILSFIETLPGERVAVPSYGKDNPLWEPYSDLLTVNAQLSVRLGNWIPQAEFKSETEYRDNGEVITHIFWALKETPSVTNTFSFTWGELR